MIATPPTNTIAKDCTSAEVNKYNSANRVLIDAGLVPAWVQTPKAAKDEEKERKAEEDRQAYKNRQMQIKNAFDEANVRIAKEHGLKPLCLYWREIYTKSVSWRHTSHIGWTVELNPVDKKCRVMANVGDSKFAEKLDTALRKLYALAAIKYKQQTEKAAAAAAAKEALTEEDRVLIIKTADVEHKSPEFIAHEDGKISLKYKVWRTYGGPHSRGELAEYTVGTFTPTAWKEWVKITEQYALESKELLKRKAASIAALGNI